MSKLQSWISGFLMIADGIAIVLTTRDPGWYLNYINARLWGK